VKHGVSETGLTEGTLLGGAIRYGQPKTGYRTGIEPIFLAAAVPAHAGNQVLEAGTGAGAGLLCLAQRVAEICGLGVEIEPEMARRAAANFAANGRPNLAVLTGDLHDFSAGLHAEGRLFDHVMANPPWHNATGSPPVGALKQRAKLAATGLAAEWVSALARVLRPRGTVTLIVPPGMVPESLAAMTEAGCGSAVLFPLWPRSLREPRIVLLQAMKGSRADFRLLPGLTLHEEAGYTAAAEAVLRHGAALPLR
jgi:tRNA1Val (adenine37-N6)-methyltransferase